ncbi:MAG: M23 family metallopeptidase [Anaerolineales bacterium]|nr:MAG: M23 family metallopeptidase [Anaerolineales bacterium]
MFSRLSVDRRQASRLIVPIVISLAAISLGIWATRLNLGSKPDEFSSMPVPLATTNSTDEVDLSLPAYPREGLGTVLTRQANLLTENRQRVRLEITHYTVQSGDTVFGIASKFEVKPETVLWGNFDVLEDDPHLLRPGQELVILPIDGTYYQWQEGDQLESVAASFGAEPGLILEWPGNKIDPADPRIEPGDWLIVPEGSRPFKQWFVPTIARGQAGVGAAYGPGGCTGSYSGSVGSGGFIWPTANHAISGNDYWSGHLAIDIAAGSGAPIWAADTGVVVFAGWSTVGYGNMVMLDHGNGWQTLYAHLSQVGVACGQSVGQGGHLGLAGSTGNSTGAHLHFEIRYEGGFVNPWFVLP